MTKALVGALALGLAVSASQACELDQSKSAVAVPDTLVTPVKVVKKTTRRTVKKTVVHRKTTRTHTSSSSANSNTIEKEPVQKEPVQKESATQ